MSMKQAAEEIEDLVMDASKGLADRMGLGKKDGAGARAEVRVPSIKDAIPFVDDPDAGTCPVCSGKWKPEHAIEYFLTGKHHTAVLEALDKLLALANEVEAMALKLATSSNPNLVHEKQILETWEKLYLARGASVANAFLNVANYYASPQRERDAVKRGSKVLLAEVQIDFNLAARRYSRRLKDLEAAWPKEGRSKLVEFYAKSAAAELAGVRASALYAETLMLGERAKATEMERKTPGELLEDAARMAALNPPPQAPPSVTVSSGPPAKGSGQT